MKFASAKNIIRFQFILMLGLFFLAGELTSQTNSVALPQNGNVSQSAAPQGALRYQRGFYLITPKEMMASGLMINDTINSIGFTIGIPQSDTTKGDFKVYLQNTTDTVSRSDTAWTEVTGITNNFFHAFPVHSGRYEWEVATDCSDFSLPTNFNVANTLSCYPPTRQVTSNITGTSATLNWIPPANSVLEYYIDYTRIDSVVVVTDTVMGPASSHNISGLVPNKTYKWGIRSNCTISISDLNFVSFSTLSADVCNEPSGLMIVATTDTLARLKWTGAAGAAYYSVRFRRVGEVNWLSTTAFADSLTLPFGLDPGNVYEWEVQTNCALGKGLWIPGPNFTTTGTTICYAPSNLSTDSITTSSAKFSWAPVAGATSYTIRYRLKQTISWANAILPMQLVHNDSICIPDTTGTYLTFFEGMSITPFVYSGGGVYVAWEYQRVLGDLSTPNSSFGNTSVASIKGAQGQDSIVYFLAFNTAADSAATQIDTVLELSKIRPETILCSPNLVDSSAVVAVYTLGKIAPNYTSTPVTALIRNFNSTSHDYSVTLKIKDAASNALRYTEMQTITIGADTVGLVAFTGWFPTINETDSIIVCIPAQTNEDVLNNNSNFYLQTVNPYMVSFADGANQLTQAGTDTMEGYTLSRQLMDGCGKINSVDVYLTASATDHAVYAVVMDTLKNLIALSVPFTPDSSQVNKYHTFYLTTPPSLKNEEYYVGLAQPKDGANAYYPVGVQWEGGQIRDSAYYRYHTLNDSLFHQALPGRLMISAEMIPAVPIPTITGDLFLCTSTVDTLIVSSLAPRFADSIIAFSSQYSPEQYSANQALGTPDVFPGGGPNPGSWLSAAPDAGREFLVLKYSNPDSINFVDIYETLNPGAVDTIGLIDESNIYHIIWSAKAIAAPNMARKNRITFPLTPYKVVGVRLALAADSIPGYNDIDAVVIGRITTPGIFSSVLWSTGATSDTIIINAPGGYKVTAIDANGCMAMDSVTSIMPTVVTPSIIARGPTSFCPGDSVWLVSNQHGHQLWSNGATTDSIAVKIVGNYSVVYDDGSGCGTTMSNVIAVTIFTPPVVNITGDTVICPGLSTTLDAGTHTSYKWSTGATTRTTTVFYANTYNVQVTDINGCKSVDFINTTLGILPTPSITGNLNFCPGDSTTLDAGAGYSSYVWSPGGQISQTKKVTIPGNQQVTVTNNDGCIGLTSVFVNVFSTANPIISGMDGYCPMDSVTISANNGFASYLWSNGDAAQSTTIKTNGTYTVTVTDANGCKTQSSKIITQYTPPDAFISGTLSFCDGGSSTSLDAGLGYQSYAWSTGATGHSITVTDTGSYSVMVTDFHGCTDTASVKVTLDGALPATPGPISGALFGMCNSSSPETYSIDNVTNSTCYIWTMPPGATIVDGFMADSNVFGNIIKVVFDNSFTGGFIGVAAHNDCGASPTFNGSTLYVSAAPGSVPGMIEGLASGICKQGAATYTLPPINDATGYLWTVPIGATIMSGQNTNSIKVVFASSYRAGDICVQYSTQCGTSPFECIQVSPTPVINTNIQGSNVLCEFANNEIYSIASVNGANEYIWTVPTGASILSGQGTPSILVNFGSHSGIVTVRASNACGLSPIKFINVTLGKCSVIGGSGKVARQLGDGDVAIKVFPNPSEGIVNISMSAGSTIGKNLIKVTDQMGRLVYMTATEGASSKLDLRQLSKGVYFIHLNNDQLTRTFKILLK